MRLLVTSLEDRSVPSAGFGLDLGHLGRFLSKANPADVQQLQTDVQAILNRQLPATQFPTLLSDAQALAASVPTGAQATATAYATAISTAVAEGQVSRQEAFGIEMAGQTALRSARRNDVPRAALTPIRQDLRSLEQAFRPTKDDFTTIRNDLRTIRQDVFHGAFVGG
jgi:hypothetical protein